MKTKPVLLVTALAFGTSCALTAGLILVIAIPFMSLWNSVPAVIFKASQLGYWQAVGLLGLLALARTAAKGGKISLKLRESL